MIDIKHNGAAVGLTSALLALHIPDAVLSSAGKLLVSLVIAVVSTVASNLVNRWMKKDKKS